MKKLSEQEVEAMQGDLAVSSARDPRREAVRQAILELQIGQAIQITKDEWPGKTHPSNNLKRLNETSGITLKIRGLADKSGWIIQRIS